MWGVVACVRSVLWLLFSGGLAQHQACAQQSAMEQSDAGDAAWTLSLMDKARATGGAGRLLALLWCTAECSKPGVKYIGGGEPFSRAFLKCPVQLYVILKKMLLPSFLLLPPCHPIIGCAALIFFKERVHLTTLFSKEAWDFSYDYDQNVLSFFSFCYYSIKAKGLPLYIFNCVVCLFLLTLSVNIIWRSFRHIGHFRFCLLSLGSTLTLETKT